MFDFWYKRRKQIEKLERKSEELKVKSEEESVKPIRVVLNGLLYDTSKAKKVIDYIVENEDMAVSGMLYGFASSTLYRTEKGRFFIEQYGRIFPCDKIEAANILKYEPKIYQEVFGKVDEA